MRRLAFVFLATLYPYQSVFAWGDTAHEAICEIAFQELNDTARERVIALIDQDSAFDTFSQSCTWPDHPRRRPSEHFMNLPRDAGKIGEDPCPTADECVVTAIASELSVLQSDANDSRKLDSLKFLGHWVGDIHQPLHVSFLDDRGGNSIRETGPCNNSLHSVWDSCILTRKLGASATAIARSLRSEISDAERTAWRDSSPVDWANESFAIATAPDVGYCVRKDEACW